MKKVELFNKNGQFIQKLDKIILSSNFTLFLDDFIIIEEGKMIQQNE
jgi:hypothetical protein